jgi:uncharacterized protein with ATP-grasp and redox domains
MPELPTQSMNEENRWMKSDLECLVCMMKQALNTVRIVTSDRDKQREVMERVAVLAQKTDLALSPAVISQQVYDIIFKVTGERDPFHIMKRKTNAAAMAMLPELRTILAEAEDKLVAALHLAAAGNIIDLGIGQSIDTMDDILHIVNTPFAVDHTARFRNELAEGKTILYLLDNSGEIVFDRLLIELLKDMGLIVTAAVKSAPIINDVMIEDAEMTGLSGLVRVIETGAGDIGLNFNNISAEFRNTFESTDMIVAKGHGHFETCNEIDENFYFLLKAKCAVVARALDVEEGDLVFKSRFG